MRPTRDPQWDLVHSKCDDGQTVEALRGGCKKLLFWLLHIPCMEYIVTSSADLTFGFWDSRRHDLRQLMPVETEVCALHWVSAEDAGLRRADSHYHGGGRTGVAPNRKTGETLDVSAALKPRSGVGGPLVDRSSEKVGNNRRRKASVLSKISQGVRVGTLYAGDVNGEIIGWGVAEMYAETD